MNDDGSGHGNDGTCWPIGTWLAVDHEIRRSVALDPRRNPGLTAYEHGLNINELGRGLSRLEETPELHVEEPAQLALLGLRGVHLEAVTSKDGVTPDGQLDGCRLRIFREDSLHPALGRVLSVGTG